MSFSSATRLGPYEIVCPLGAGGMGEVYRAKDTRLGRDVAIKVLPADLSSSAELRLRLEREARAISSLQHPHICVLHDIGHQDGIDYLVMEYLEGETLADRLQKGALPLEQALNVAIQIADALDRAHRHGIIHRDLKPGNIMLTRAGAKLLDFGLAKPVAVGTRVAASAAPITPISPTSPISGLTVPSSPMTQHGALVGTYQYMAPEVLQGGEADARSDIFSFGCVLYEMVTGRRAFEGKSQISVFAAILEKEPEAVSRAQPLVPATLDRIIYACLAKEPEQRFQTMHDLRMQLQWVSEAPAPVAAAVADRRPSRFAWLGWAVAIVALAAVAVAIVSRAGSVQPGPAMQTYILPPEKSVFHFTGEAPGPPAISPDGTQIVFGAAPAGDHPMLWMRPVGSLMAQPLPDTEHGAFPFWSPDSKYIGFFAEGKLKKIEVSGGAPQTICDAPVGRGGTWNRDGVILFAPFVNGPIYRVSAAGGDAVPVTQMDPHPAQNTHRWPSFLPDGHHYLYLAANQGGVESDEANAIYVASLDSKAVKRIAAAKSNAVYAAGHIFYVRGGDLIALPFDARRLEVTSDPVRVAQNVQSDFAVSRATFTLSDNGTLVYGIGAGEVKQQLTWYDVAGKVLGTAGEPRIFKGIRISPDAKSLAAPVDTGNMDLWIYDFQRGVNTRFTNDAGGTDPVWSPDGKQLVFTYRHGDLYIKAADGSTKEEPLVKDNTFLTASDWSRDGKFLLFTKRPQKNEIWALPMQGERKPFPVVVSNSNNTDAQFSPDGHWIAYDSPESGRIEIYVTRFPGPGPKIQVSSDGGDLPRWSRDGKTIYFVDSHQSKIMAADVEVGSDSVRVGKVRPLFAPRMTYVSSSYAYDVAPDGRKFLIVADPADEPPSRLAIVSHWSAELNK